jgi:hypothetical protein
VNKYGIKKKNSNPFNPQSNGIMQRFHLKLNDSLRTAEIDGRKMDEKDPWGPFLASAAYAIRSTFHTTLKSTHGTAHKIYGRPGGQVNNSAKRKWVVIIEDKMPL